MHPPPTRCAIILAGGRSVRMGQPKATLPWDDRTGDRTDDRTGDRTMLEHVAGVVGQCCEHVVVVGHAGLELPSLPPTCTRVDDPAALDDQGPLAGTHCGLMHLAASYPADTPIYLAAVDKPLVTAEHIEFMFAQLEAPGVEAALPVLPDAGRSALQPLAAAVRLGPACAAAGALLDAGERALKRLFVALPHRAVPAHELPTLDALRDCNTPSQYDALRQRATPPRA